ncbi:MAG: LysR family transcriptional regulator [Pseudomonadota bacterium]
MKNWSEILTAYQVGRLGTVSAAADHLGVHRATVIRHVDALEAELGGKLFHRHKKGYAPTELGHELIRMAEFSERQFLQLIGKAKGTDAALEGEFTVTSIDLAVHLFLPALRQFQSAQPGLRVHYIDSAKPLRLEYGEAHIAFRVGGKPDHPDYVVRRFGDVELGLFAHEDYVKTYGKAGTLEDNRSHRFIVMDGTGNPAPLAAWTRRNVPEDAVALHSTGAGFIRQAIVSGHGIGFLPLYQARVHSELVEAIERHPSWKIPVWMVTHVDLHRSAKVQGFISVLNEHAER